MKAEAAFIRKTRNSGILPPLSSGDKTGQQGRDNEVWFQEQEDQRQSPVSEYHDLQASVSWISGESQGYVMQPAEEGRSLPSPTSGFGERFWTWI